MIELTFCPHGSETMVHQTRLPSYSHLYTYQLRCLLNHTNLLLRPTHHWWSGSHLLFAFKCPSPSSIPSFPNYHNHTQTSPIWKNKNQTPPSTPYSLPTPLLCFPLQKIFSSCLNRHLLSLHCFLFNPLLSEFHPILLKLLLSKWPPCHQVQQSVSGLAYKTSQ